jgi:glyoxylase-like metal-dependent hydrolase (beta-lactamase superfamily II)
MTTDATPSLPVVTPWYRVVPVEDGRIVRIDEPFADPLVAANVWVVRGRDRDLLVDTGLGLAPLDDAVPLVGERDPLVVVTHGHLDHAGGASQFARVHAHPAEDLARPRPASLHGSTELDLLGIHDPLIRADVGEWLVAAAPHHGFDPTRYAIESPTEVVDVGDGSVFDLGERRLVALHLPGHSPGSIALFDEHDGALFSGDVVYDGVLFDELDGADTAEYVRSLARLLTLDARVVYPGHGEAFGPDRLEAIVAGHIRKRDHDTGPSEPRSR